MESFLGIFMIVGWFLLRFGLPIGVTFLICWVLHKLDSHWQKEGGESLEPVNIGKLTTLLTCWIVHDCPEKQRKQCLAYQSPDIPCWQHFRSPDGNLRNRCVG
jgi:hypothetical protein